jgi:hypothetical protein
VEPFLHFLNWVPKCQNGWLLAGCFAYSEQSEVDEFLADELRVKNTV